MPRLSGFAPERLREEILRRARNAPVPTQPEAIVERALGYPFDPPPDSYVLVGGSDLRFCSVKPGKLAKSTVVHRETEMSLEQACGMLGVASAALEAPRHLALAYGSNGSPRALQRFKSAPDQLFPALHEYLNRNIIGNQVLVDQAAAKIELHLRSGRKTDFDFLEADANQQSEHFQLFLDAHRNRQRLIAVAQIYAAPDRKSVV